MLQEIRTSLRRLRRQAGTTAVLLLTLTVAMGATTTMFGILHGVLLRPLNFPDPEQLVHLQSESAAALHAVSYPDFADLRESVNSLQAAAAWQGWSVTLEDEGGTPTRQSAASVSQNFFALLGVQPHLGRFFSPEEGRVGHQPVVVLSFGAWQRFFGGDPNIIGASIRMSGEPYTIIGVTPRDFEDPVASVTFRNDPKMWRSRPAHFDENSTSRGWIGFWAIGRLAPGASIEQTAQEMAVISDRLESAYPEYNKGKTFVPKSFQERLIQDVRPAILMLFAFVVALLLIAAANAGNILLTGTIRRGPENAVRIALGAQIRDLWKASMTESLTLSALAAFFSTALAWVALRWLSTLPLDWLPRANQLGIDFFTVAFSIVLAGVTPVVLSLAPMLQLRRSRLADALRQAGRGAAHDSRTYRIRAALVVIESALAVVLLAGAGLLIRSFWELSNVDTGINTAQILTFRATFAPDRYPSGPQVTGGIDRVVEEVRAQPGIVRVGAVSDLPMSGQVNSTDIRRLDRPRPGPGDEYEALVRAVTPEYFEVLRIPLIGGRTFQESDDLRAAPVAIVNQLMASQLFAGEDPIGHIVSVRGVAREIVGVVGDVKQFGLAQPGRPALYEPSSQETVDWVRQSMSFVVEADGPTELFHDLIRRSIRNVDPSLPVNSLSAMSDYISQDLAAPKFRTALALSFAVLATFLAGLGLSAVIAFSISQRTREIAIRMSVGASSVQVFRKIVMEGLRLTAAGTAAGVVLSLILGHLMTSLLFQTPPTDSAVMIGVPFFLMVVAAVAASIPALRAIRIQPVEALKAD